MIEKPDTTLLNLADSYVGDDETETRETERLHACARDFLNAHPWCEAVLDVYVGMTVAPALAVFLVSIEPIADADEWLWAVVGDLPPAYIDYHPSLTPNAACALDAYVGAMSDWVDAVRRGDEVDQLIPVDVSPTPEHADLLDQRLRFIATEILSQYADDLRRS